MLWLYATGLVPLKVNNSEAVSVSSKLFSLKVVFCSFSLKVTTGPDPLKVLLMYWLPNPSFAAKVVTSAVVVALR